jgi:hypothetical protein
LPRISEDKGRLGSALRPRLQAVPTRPHRRLELRGGNPRHLEQPVRLAKSRGTEGLQTHRWRKADSNSWSHPERNGNGRAPAPTSIILREHLSLRFRPARPGGAKVPDGEFL